MNVQGSDSVFCLAAHSSIHTGVECPVKYSLSQPMWSLFFVSQVSLDIHCWKPHRYLKEFLWILHCLMSTRNSAFGFSRGDDLKGRSVWIASTFSSVCFLLLKKQNRKSTV